MEGMKEYPDNFFDLAIVDPPYGAGKNVMNYTATPKARKNKRTQKHMMKGWNIERPSPDYFNELFRISKNQIICGGNYFDLPISRGWIFWDKKYENTYNFSAGELIWTSFDCLLKKVLVTNRIMPFQILENIHPTQKPIALYRWLLQNYANPGDIIVDTHVGSASSLIAFEAGRFEYVGWEIDKDYYEAAQKRIKQFRQQPTLWEQHKGQEARPNGAGKQKTLW